MKKTLALIIALMMMLMALPSFAETTVENFDVEYEMKGTTSSGKPKNDTFIFKGVTTDGVITELTFDIIRNKGTEGEYSKTDIMGYMMNVSDAEITKDGENFNLSKFTTYGYDTAYAEGASAQYMVNATLNNITPTSTFKELTFQNYAGKTEVTMDMALIAYQDLAQEYGIKLTEDTLLIDLIAPHGRYVDGAFVEGANRVSFAGYAGGRSYGEQIKAIETYILENKMTLEDTYEMFKTVNQTSTPIEERDVIAGATITFVGDFQRMVYIAMHGELFSGVIDCTETEKGYSLSVVTQGYAGEIESNVGLDKDGNLVSFSVRDANETPNFGAELTPEGSDFITALVSGNGTTDVVAGSTVTSNALLEAVVFAQKYLKEELSK